jgi:hypothetical protein
LVHIDSFIKWIRSSFKILLHCIQFKNRRERSGKIITASPCKAGLGEERQKNKLTDEHTRQKLRKSFHSRFRKQRNKKIVRGSSSVHKCGIKCTTKRGTPSVHFLAG